MEYFELYDEALTKFGDNPTDDLHYLLESIDENNLTIDKVIITKAFNLCYEIHKEEKRSSGVPYYTHPLSVALILIEELQINETSLIVVALLHSILRNSKVGLKFIRKEFGQTIALLLARFTRMIKYTKSNKTGPDALYLMFTLLIKDTRIVLLQLCNRLHDMRTLQYVSEQSQKATAQDTLNFYIPFAHKFGLSKIQSELENRSFYFVNPVQYKKNIDFLKEQKEFYSKYVSVIMDNIKAVLKKQNISNNIKVLHKQEYELFLQLSEIKTNGMDNILSLCVVVDVDDISECYKIYELIIADIKYNNLVDVLSHPVTEIDNSLSVELYRDSRITRINIKTKAMDEADKPVILQKISNNEIKFSDSQISDNDIRL
jgi:GTP pyrophosphokinase